MNMSCQRCLCRTCAERKTTCPDPCKFEYGCETVVTKCRIRDKTERGTMKRLNDEYLKTKEKWAKVLNVIPKAPKAPGMTDAQILMLGAGFFALMAIALLLGGIQ
jgi:hypothetical protein